jgi:hypothetical protein
VETNSWVPVAIVLNGDDTQDEPLGTKEKFWVLNPTDQHPWLFKFARTVDGETRGEDWAEWIVHHLALEIGIPTAEVRPAQLDSRRGIVSKSVVTPGSSQRLVHGNSLLAEQMPGYDATSRRENPGYTVEAVQTALTDVGPPLGAAAVDHLSGFDVWAAFLALDAVVAGRDRHHENWAVVSDQSRRTLSPSFDHGNALGFQEHDARRQRCIDDPVILTNWNKRGRSHHFAGKPDLVALAHAALEIASQDARDYVRNSLSAINVSLVRSIVDCVPSEIMSEVARKFATVVIEHNTGRVLNGYPAN